MIKVLQSPPWHFVKYNNYSEYTDSNDDSDLIVANESSLFSVTGGRDFHLLKLIAKKMNFNVNYVDLLERTQGSSISEADADNLSFSGALGKIQRRVTIPKSLQASQHIESKRSSLLFTDNSFK